MIKRYVFGTPLETDAVLNKPAACGISPLIWGNVRMPLFIKWTKRISYTAWEKMCAA